VTAAVGDPFATAKAVADAVLYEGYVLYPYRASSRKNQIRWQFGVLTPRAFSEADGSERWSMRTECLLEPASSPALRIRVRCLQVQHRSVETHIGDEFVPAGVLELDGTSHVDWDEAAERVVDLDPIPIADLLAGGRGHEFRFEAGAAEELLKASNGTVAGRLVRRRGMVEGRLAVAAERVGDYVKVVVTVENVTEWSLPQGRATRDEAMGRSLVAVHTMLAVDGGRFLSLLDPPPDAAEAASRCHSDGTYPVLIADDDGVVLSSPIILYDHPAVAPESPGDLYDSTEIDEILALRVMTLTDEEKAEARGTDARAAAIIDRCDDLPPELWERLHGAVRAIHPLEGRPVEEKIEEVPWWDPGVDASVDPSNDSVMICGVDVRRGTSVRLRPSRRSDAQDLFLDGRPATVAAIFRDVDDNDYVAVTLDDDPAAGELEWQGRYRYFYPDEMEPLP
jgi:hypothetical protein